LELVKKAQKKEDTSVEAGEIKSIDYIFNEILYILKKRT